MLHVFGLWRKPKHPMETHADIGRTCRFHTERPPGSAETQTVDLLAVRRHHATRSPKYVTLNSKDLLNTAATSINLAWHLYPSIFQYTSTQRKPRPAEEEHANSIQNSFLAQLWLEPGTLLLWSDSAIHWATHHIFFFLLIKHADVSVPIAKLVVSSITPQKERSGLQWAADCNISRVTQSSSSAPESYKHTTYTTIINLSPIKRSDTTVILISQSGLMVFICTPRLFIWVRDIHFYLLNIS